VSREKLKELAVEIAQGAASADERGEFDALLTEADQESRHEVAQLLDLAALLALPLAQQPPAGLKAKILAKATGLRVAAAPSLVSFVRGNDPSGWVQLPVPGASLKVLSVDRERGYAVVVGKLEAGSRYPAHTHLGSEEVYVVSGDLTIQGTRLEAGDFHHAEAGSRHDINYSETGCVVIVVLSLEDLQRQYAANA
jgi:quercetin dioxygenase-like cupin family protein